MPSNANEEYQEWLERGYSDSSEVPDSKCLVIRPPGGEPEALRRLSASQLRYGTTVISARAAASAVDDVDYVRLAIKRNSDDRQEFMNAVNTRMLRALDSHANFTMMDPLRPVDMVIDHLKKNSVLVAPRIPAMEKYFRVSFGTPEEMQEFWRVMDLLPPTGKMAM